MLPSPANPAAAGMLNTLQAWHRVTCLDARGDDALSLFEPPEANERLWQRNDLFVEWLEQVLNTYAPGLHHKVRYYILEGARDHTLEVYWETVEAGYLRGLEHGYRLATDPHSLIHLVAGAIRTSKDNGLGRVGCGHPNWMLTEAGLVPTDPAITQRPRPIPAEIPEPDSVTD